MCWENAPASESPEVLGQNGSQAAIGAGGAGGASGATGVSGCSLQAECSDGASEVHQLRHGKPQVPLKQRVGRQRHGLLSSPLSAANLRFGVLAEKYTLQKTRLHVKNTASEKKFETITHPPLASFLRSPRNMLTS